MNSNPIRDFVFSLIRTLVPNVIAGGLAWIAANTDIVIDENTKAQATILFFGIAFGIYYFVVRLFETYVSPKFSGFLGDFRKGKTVPVYADPTHTTIIAPTGEPA